MSTLPPVSRHAHQRVEARRLPADTLPMVLTHGRVAHLRGTAIHAIGRREVATARHRGLDLRPYEGIQVICDPLSGTVITVYRNHDFRSLRPRTRHR